MKTKTYYYRMFGAVAVLLAIHYLIYYIFKNDEPYFFLLAFGIAAWVVTVWIFGVLKKRKLNRQ